MAPRSRWTGVRAPALLRDAAPTWGAAIDLFDGASTAGWRQRGSQAACWKVEGGALMNSPKCVDIISERTFSDFKLHAEFSYPPGSNSGIYLRGRYEVQINDDAGRVTDALRMGGVYGFLRPYADAALKPGQPQSYDITLIGRRVTVVLNGKTIIDNEIIPGHHRRRTGQQRRGARSHPAPGGSRAGVVPEDRDHALFVIV